MEEPIVVWYLGQSVQARHSLHRRMLCEYVVSPPGHTDGDSFITQAR